MNRHPFFPGLDEFLSRPVQEEANATMTTEQAAVHGHGSGSDMIPAGKIFAVEELPAANVTRLNPGNRRRGSR